jgi:hypothetical protein
MTKLHGSIIFLTSLLTRIHYVWHNALDMKKLQGIKVETGKNYE